MKKLTLAFSVLCTLLSAPCFAQWIGSGDSGWTWRSGSVGIGADNNSSTYVAKLNIENFDEYNIRLKNKDAGSTDWLIGTTRASWGAGAGKLVFTNTGNSVNGILTLMTDKLGIGNSNPKVTLDVGTQYYGALASVLARVDQGNTTLSGSYLGVRAGTLGANEQSFMLEHSYYGNINSSIAFHVGATSTGGFISFSTNTNAEKMRILANGNVCIGNTNDLGYKLAVNGSIGAKEVNVTTAGWPDYVFNNGYNLRPLTEIEKYIASNHHLPEVPSAAEVEKNGVNVGEMNALLLKKIEELTLYIINQEKRIQQLEAQR